MESSWLTIFGMSAVFFIGYFLITIEHFTKVNKATVAILMAIACWAVAFADGHVVHDVRVQFLHSTLAEIFQVTFFLLGALAVIEIINQHRGFTLISKAISIDSKKQLLWIICLLTFFLSAVLDNLTTTVVMVTLLKKLIDESPERWLIGSAIVIAANCGGAWTPIGDVTTTMLWIGGRLSSGNIVQSLLFPSLICLGASTFMLSRHLKGNFSSSHIHPDKDKIEPLGKCIFFLGIALLIFVPVFKALTGLPPFMGMLLALCVLWVVTDLFHRDHPGREHLKVPYILGKIDLSSVLFFMGILLCVGALFSEGILQNLAMFLDRHMTYPLVAIFIGFASAIVDNVPLVAAAMGMYPVQQYPLDHEFWSLVAYTAGTGGSMLIIGSAAGVALMGLEKIDFIWYFRKAFIPAMIGYLAGFFSYFGMQLLASLM